MLELLAALSLSAAAGFRTALPLLVIGLLQGEAMWTHVPLLSRINSELLLILLISWSLFELMLSKWFLGQRILQNIQLFLSPLVGAIAGLTVLYAHEHGITLWVVGIVGALLAFVLQLVQAGWSYRLRGLPIWSAFLQDILCLVLVFSAFGAPAKGGLIALLLLLLAIRSAESWRGLQRRSPRSYPRFPSQRYRSRYFFLDKSKNMPH